ncbi:MAG: ABC transporter permease [Pyrinomonadaceae bacterium]
MGALLQDVRYAVRVLWKQPAFTAVAVLAVALGVGANTTMFSTVDALLLRPFSFRAPERVLMIWEQNLQIGMERGSVAPANFYDMRARAHTLENFSAYYDKPFNLSEGDKPERIEGTVVSASLFAAVDARPLLGRAFTAEDEAWGKDKVVVLGHGLWRRRFGADAGIVGREVRLNGESYTVVGVMPPKFSFPPNGSEIWKPLSFDAADAADRGSHFLRVLGRLRDGATPEEARAELSVIARQLEQQYPETNTGRGFSVQSLNAYYTRGARPFLLVLLGAVGFVLLLACANVANLLLVRGASRQKEIAIRMAMGASRARLVRQLLTESVVLSLVGGALGVLLAVWGVALTAGSMPQSMTRYIPGWENLGVNRRALLFTLVVSALTGVVFGLAPALQAVRTSFNDALKEGGRTSGAHARSRLRSLLVVAEVTLSLVLLVGAGLMIKSFVGLAHVEPGFNPSNAVVMDLSLAGEKYDKPESRVDFYQQLLGKIASLPGVEHAGAVNILPLSHNNTSANFKVEGRTPPPKGQEPDAGWRTVSPDYTATMNIPLRRGRYLSERDDRTDAPRVILVNETFAARFFAGQEPLGQRLDFGDAEKKGYWEIVGVLGDVRHSGLEEKIEPEVYVAHAKSPWRGMTVVVRTKNDPVQIVSAVQNELRSVDRDQPIFDVRTLDRVVHESIAGQRISAWMMGVFALIALLLATIGIYAVMSYAVTQRTHEIGVRLALGAQPADILRMIVGQGMLLTLVGLGLGLGSALLLAQAMTKVLYNVTATDPTTFASLSIFLTLVALAANYFPARRATRVDPMQALRHE